MTMRDRRQILTAGAGVMLTGVLPRLAGAQTASMPAFAPMPGAWRQYEVRTRVEIAKREGPAQAWIPTAGFTAEAWMRPGGTTWSIESGEARVVRDTASGAAMVHAVWSSGTAPARIEVVDRFSGRDRSTAADGRVALDATERQRYLAASDFIPVDGIVRTTAERIIEGAQSPIDRVRRIYDWIVETTHRDPKTRGCGAGDIARMLETQSYGGKCADLNALFVGLARASGIPARDIYGIRVAPSAFGYKSLGANSPTITKAQHCRAEVYIDGTGWMAMDPADVRKVMLEEPPGNLPAADLKVKAARAALFGAWETNWLAYNDAHDVKLPGSAGPPVPFLMYPQAEIDGARLDPLEPDSVSYVITAKELAA